ncbi:MAG TPA: hypothetical protein VFW24_08760, partial [Acidimicrobiales bacterium]|nr:hypothetical protein [Acidimicrobiales bacterium]
LASDPVAGPEPDFTADLEARLRMAHSVRPAGEAVAPSGATTRRRSRRAPSIGWLGWLAPGALAGAGIAGFVLVSGGTSTAPRPTGPAVEVAHAVDAQSIAPDGRTTPLRPGDRLPDGTIVRTGTDGQVDADGTALGPDSEAVVHGGHLTVLGHGHRHAPAPTVTTQPAPSPVRPAAPPNGGTRSGGETPASPPAPSHPTPTAPPGQGHGHAAPAQLDLSVQPGSRGTELTWSSYGGPGLYGYVVLRSNPPDDPAYPRDVIHFVPAGSLRSYADPPGRGARYQIDAIDSSGDVLAASAVEH